LILSNQIHLTYNDKINYGSFYTPKHIVEIVYDLINKHTLCLTDYKIIDTSCGYGNFLIYPNSIGADIDSEALTQTFSNTNCMNLFEGNSLLNVHRSKYNLKSKDKIIIVGNPPYNDKTSKLRNDIKEVSFEIDKDLQHRDLGVSFMLSYNKLQADYVCVLHPLSYLIKKTNFKGLSEFFKNFSLIDAVIISSGEFSETSKATHFPIIIALYKRDDFGMSYPALCNYTFYTIEGKKYKLNQFDKLCNYITKYPNKWIKNYVAHFLTMRDINALKRSKTFIENETANSIRIQPENLDYYCYADIFKEYIQNIPYYLGNNDVMIDIDKFKEIKEIFVYKSMIKYQYLQHLIPKINNYDEKKIEIYFKNLLGEHYVDMGK